MTDVRSQRRSEEWGLMQLVQVDVRYVDTWLTPGWLASVAVRGCGYSGGGPGCSTPGEARAQLQRELAAVGFVVTT